MLHNAIAPDLADLLDAGSPGDIDFYSQYARHKGGPVLVLMCGTGRVVIAMARQSVPGIGLDADPGKVEAARRKAVVAGASRTMFVRAEPTGFVSDVKHPLVIIPAGGLQQLLTQDEQRACLLSVRSALQLGGTLLLDLPLLDPTTIAQRESFFRRAGERMAHIAIEREYDSARQVVQEIIACDWLDADGMVAERRYAANTMRYMTPGEAVLLLEACGFAPTCFGGFDRQALLPGAVRFVVEAERNR